MSWLDCNWITSFFIQKSKRSNQTKSEISEQLKKSNVYENEEEGEDSSFSDHSSSSSSSSDGSSGSDSASGSGTSSGSSSSDSSGEDGDENIVHNHYPDNKTQQLKSDQKNNDQVSLEKIENTNDFVVVNDDLLEIEQVESVTKFDDLIKVDNVNAKDQVDSSLSVRMRKPIHNTCILFMPHIPLNIFKRDLDAVSIY